MNKRFWRLIMVSYLLLLKWCMPAYAKDQVKTVLCDSAKSQVINIPFGRVTVLSFPVKPKEILPGNSSFDFKYIKNDLAIKALSRSARTNVFVYLLERRCAFDLRASTYGYDIIEVRDAKDKQIEVKYHE